MRKKRSIREHTSGEAILQGGRAGKSFIPRLKRGGIRTSCSVRQAANQLTAWVEATSPKIAQKRYLARFEAHRDEQERLLAEAMALELLCEEIQACVRSYSTLRLLRGAVQHMLQAMQRELDRSSDSYQSQDGAGASGAWIEGRFLAYATALKELAETIQSQPGR
jgi:hypothetical protein